MRMKWIAFIIGCVLLGCTGESAVSVSSDALTPLVVRAPSFLDVESTPIVTRTNTTVTSGSLGIFLVANSGFNYAAIDNAQYDYVNSSSNWMPNASDAKFIYLNSNAASVYAYYPYSATHTNLNTIPMVSQKYAVAADLCYTKSASAPTSGSPSVSLALSHAYSKITINLKKINTQSDGAITNISLHNDAICKEASLNMTNGNYTSTKLSTVSSPFSFNPEITTLPLYDASNVNTVVATSVLLIPVTALNGSTIDLSMTVGGIDRATTVTIPSANLIAGVNYEVTVTIDASVIISTTAKCTDWVSVPSLPVIKPHK